MRSHRVGFDRVRHASWNPESNREWFRDHGQSRTGSCSSSRSRNSGFLHAPHVTTKGTDGSFAIPHGDGLAKGEIAKRHQALVLAGRAGIPLDSGDESAPER